MSRLRVPFTNVDLQGQNLDEKKKDEVPIPVPVAIISQAKLVSTKSSPAPQPPRNKATKVCDFITIALFIAALLYALHRIESQERELREHHNNLVRYVNHIKDTLVRNQEILFNTIDGMTNALGKRAEDFQTLKDSTSED